jgi:ligand-binding SRPBCC domain-containing protein
VWEQWVPQAPEALWPFFCDAHNLEQITPPFLRFRVLGRSSGEIGAGSLIDYRLRLDGVPIRWQSRIEAWDPPRAFVDTQVKGPYRLWHHTHEFEPVGAGTLMRDTVRYQLRGGWLGRLAAGGRVASYVERIFDYRARKIDQLFGK